MSFTLVKAQDKFEGTITFEITYQKIPDQLQGMESMLPTKSIIKLKGSKIRTEVPMSMGGDQVIIFDQETKSGHMLMNILGSKMAITLSKEDIMAEEEKFNKPEITYMDEYKTIAGYKCQKAISKTTDDQGNEFVSEVYFTEKIPNLTQNFEGLKGIALQYVSEQDGVKSTLTASSVIKEVIPANQFLVPDDYEMKTLEELEQN